MKKVWVRILLLAIATAMILSIAACGNKTETETTGNETTHTESESQPVVTTEKTTPTESETESSATEETQGEDSTDAETLPELKTDPETLVETETDVETQKATETEFVTEFATAAESTTETESETVTESETEIIVTTEETTFSNETTNITDITDVTDVTDVTDNTETTEETEVTTENKVTDATETDDNVETTETTEEVTELVYGYNFEDNSWSELYNKAGSATRSIVSDPAGSGNLVLAVVHSESQTESYIKNKNAFENTVSGKVTVGVDLYIPSDALDESSDAVQMQINGEYSHHCNLVSDAKSSLSAFDTKDFPRDKWFTVRFVFNMDSLRYNVEVVEDGQVRTTIFAGRSASSLAGVGPLVLRVHVSGNDQTVYLDHMGVVTTKVVVGGGEQIPEEETVSDVSFLRIEGINAAGEKLSVYGDFTGKATVADLTELTWEKSYSYKGTYTAVSGATSPEYTPEGGGYYLRVKAKFGVKTLTSYPVYIQEKANNSFYHSYASLDGTTLSAAVVYNNEFSAMDAELKAVIHYSDYSIFSYINVLGIKQGSDLVIFTFDVGDKTVTKVELTVTAGGKTLCEAELSEDMPKAKLKETKSGSSVYIGKDMIADFAQNRYMRFRSTPENDHWIGTEHNPIDMGFAYQEVGVAGLANNSVELISAPGAFKIVFEGEKAGIKTTQVNELIGFWDAEKQEFTYIYNCSMTADSKSWHNNSSWAAQGRIEPFDYHLERMSILDRVYNNNQNGDLYDYVIYENGNELVRIPKLPVPRTAISGTYFYGFFLSPGESVYYPDPVEGGWKSTILSDSGDTYVEICWSWYDMHSCSENSVPMLGNCDEFTVSQSWLFATTNAEHDAALIGDAVEVDWRDLPNYQLPLFSTDNTFETQFGGTDWQYAWWKSTYDCTMDAEVGHEGTGSVKISKTNSGEASWYTEGVWGFPYSFDDVRGKTYRVSGYIKTENVVGEAYIANIQYQHATPGDNTVHKSEVITGTTDWTYVTFTFTAQQRTKADGNTQNCIDHFFLTLNGTGTVWFDDVKIEEVVE